MSDPDVSVIVPTHRREDVAARAVASALAQKDVSVEVIVLDDTAEGSARDVIASVSDSRVSYVKRESPSRGRPALVRNDGMGRARGAYLHFLDDDDALVDDALASLLAPLRSRDVGMSFGVVDVFGDDERVVAAEKSYYTRAALSARSCGGSRRRIAREILFGTAPFITSACLVRREVAQALGGFNRDLAVAEDFEFFLRAARGYGAIFVDRPVLRHRTGPPSLSRSVGKAAWFDAYSSIYQTYRRQFGALEFHMLHAWARMGRYGRMVLPHAVSAG